MVHQRLCASEWSAAKPRPSAAASHRPRTSWQAGASTLRRLGGLAAASPLLAVLFLLPALNLGGIPPFSGFLGKVALLQAGAQDGSVLAWVLVGGSVTTSLLTLYVLARVYSKAFWRSRADAPEGALAVGGRIAETIARGAKRR